MQIAINDGSGGVHVMVFPLSVVNITLVEGLMIALPAHAVFAAFDENSERRHLPESLANSMRIVDVQDNTSSLADALSGILGEGLPIVKWANLSAVNKDRVYAPFDSADSALPVEHVLYAAYDAFVTLVLFDRREAQEGPVIQQGQEG
jgi:hypothetical protein